MNMDDMACQLLMSELRMERKEELGGGWEGGGRGFLCHRAHVCMKVFLHVYNEFFGLGQGMYNTLYYSGRT